MITAKRNWGPCSCQPTETAAGLISAGGEAVKAFQERHPARESVVNFGSGSALGSHDSARLPHDEGCSSLLYGRGHSGTLRVGRDGCRQKEWGVRDWGF